MSNTSVQTVGDLSDGDHGTEDAGKLTEADRAHTGRVGPAIKTIAATIVVVDVKVV